VQQTETLLRGSFAYMDLVVQRYKWVHIRKVMQKHPHSSCHPTLSECQQVCCLSGLRFNSEWSTRQGAHTGIIKLFLNLQLRPTPPPLSLPPFLSHPSDLPRRHLSLSLHTHSIIRLLAIVYHTHRVELEDSIVIHQGHMSR